MSNKNKIQTNWIPDILLNETIDLLDDNRGPRAVGESWVIEVENKKSKLNFFKSNKKVDLDLKVKIFDMSISSMLEVNEGMPLLRLHCNGNIHEIFGMRPDNGYNIHLNDFIETFTLQFNTASIQDILTPQTSQPKSYPIKFKVGLFYMDGTCICETSVQINVMGVHVMTIPEINFKYKSNRQSIKYDRTLGTEVVGTLKIKNPSQLVFAPALNLDAEIVVKRDGEILNPNDPENPIMVDLTAHQSLDIEQEDSRGLNFSLNNLTRGASISLPITVDYKTIGNPVTSADGSTRYEITANIRYSNITEPDVRKTLIYDVTPALEVKKNSEYPTLEIQVTDPNTGKSSEFEDKATIRLNQIKFQPGSGLVTPIKLKFANLAAEGASGAGIYVENLAINIRHRPDISLKKRRKNEGVDTLFSLTDKNDRFFLPNEQSSRTVDILFDGNQVLDLSNKSGSRPDYNVTIGIEFSFDYFIDEEATAQFLGETFFADPSRRNHFKGYIMVPLYQLPNPEWLAIDFGTSAIVAQYGKKMLDLHNVKRYIPRPADAAEDNYEIDTPFLSSNIVLRQLGEAEVAEISQLTRDNHGLIDFDKQALFLSPTSYEEQANSDRVIPCLKLIVGYDLLPNIGNYDKFTYQYRDDQGNLTRTGLIIEENEDGYDFKDPTPLAYIDTIFGEVYNELLRYYIRPTIAEDMRKINRLVLTIPNTYTPRHQERIEEIVRTTLSDINIREIKFVSESDAVACYYQANWSAINKKVGRDTSGGLGKSENVLVYDIGAGTLDVTLFNKYAHSSGKTTIQVLGKLGVAKAGNYLDALLAMLLARKFTSMQTLADPQKITDASRVKGALELKAFIKNKIKPALSEEETTFNIHKNLDLGIKKDEIVDLNNLILAQPKFREYIQSITSSFLDNFFNFFGIDQKTKIDTVLLSGRTAKLKAISTALESALHNRGSNNLKIIPISNLNEDGERYDKSKTIVVEGAVLFANLYSDEDSQVEFISPVLNANYGIIYKENGVEKYVELLNPRDYPNRKGVAYSSKPVELNLGSVLEIKLVQTFSSNTAEEWSNGDREYITVMAEVSLASVSNRTNSRLSIEVDENSYLTLKLNGQQLQGLTSSKIDINSKSNARSLWPMRCNVNEN